MKSLVEWADAVAGEFDRLGREPFGHRTMAIRCSEGHLVAEVKDSTYGPVLIAHAGHPDNLKEPPPSVEKRTGQRLYVSRGMRNGSILPVDALPPWRTEVYWGDHYVLVNHPEIDELVDRDILLVCRCGTAQLLTYRMVREGLAKSERKLKTHPATRP